MLSKLNQPLKSAFLPKIVSIVFTVAFGLALGNCRKSAPVTLLEKDATNRALAPLPANAGLPAKVRWHPGTEAIFLSTQEGRLYRYEKNWKQIVSSGVTAYTHLPTRPHELLVAVTAGSDFLVQRHHRDRVSTTTLKRDIYHQRANVSIGVPHGVVDFTTFKDRIYAVTQTVGVYRSNDRGKYFKLFLPSARQQVTKRIHEDLTKLGEPANPALILRQATRLLEVASGRFYLHANRSVYESKNGDRWALLAVPLGKDLPVGATYWQVGRGLDGKNYWSPLEMLSYKLKIRRAGNYIQRLKNGRWATIHPNPKWIKRMNQMSPDQQWSLGRREIMESPVLIRLVNHRIFVLIGARGDGALVTITGKLSFFRWRQTTHRGQSLTFDARMRKGSIEIAICERRGCSIVTVSSG